MADPATAIHPLEISEVLSAPGRCITRNTERPMRSLLKLTSRSKREKPPTLEPIRFNRAQKERREMDLCIACGERPPEHSSYICGQCASDTSLEDIQNEIGELRKRILNNS